jgi:hypothetical protein
MREGERKEREQRAVFQNLGRAVFLKHQIHK